MDNRIKNYCKWEVAFALSWNVLVLGVCSIMCLAEGVAFSENIEVDSWLGFYICYAMLHWFGFILAMPCVKNTSPKERLVKLYSRILAEKK